MNSIIQAYCRQLAGERLRRSATGHVVLKLKAARADGTTHLVIPHPTDVQPAAQCQV